MDEINAVKALKKGDRLAYKYLFHAYYNRLVAYITTYSHDRTQSEDIVQQTFINLWINREKLDDTQSPKGYLYAIAHNIYIDAINASKKKDVIMIEIWERALRDRIEEDSDAQEKRIQKIKYVIETLPPECRKIIRMNKLQGIKYKEIALELKISIKTVESQMRIAFSKIREAFKDDSLLLFLLLH
ncbi:RNA polymerase sigma-70 factor [Maribacter sp. ANRC-HE7]|uniref:RNA polymerase sigma-70 factor n=1 Tax=Maribacter aquimaris TaxID=2737171 RepID=A0ABR7UZA6_9FLAO|nr:RNA polymerase sigma-70 factor [Maribacter aquimaris]MBD0777592.1 RNA polymerase sigma-70 factor [Maribacter aquimaris]